MKILVVADWHREIYAEALYNAFNELGHETFKFSWKEYFKHCQYAKSYNVKCNKVQSFYYRFQNRFTFGPVLNKINKDLIASVNKIKPDLIFVYRGTHIYPKTFKILRQISSAKIYGYNNDDPFSKSYPTHFWRHFKNSLPFYHHIFSFRHKNILDYKEIGITNTSLLRFYYLKKNIYPILDIEKKYDVIFIGHFENDNRDLTIRYLMENGINIRIFGPNWEKSKYYEYFISKINGKIEARYGELYNQTINEAKIALVFLSKLNSDTYTTRCFEIPATNTMMISEYTEDLAMNMFKEGKEADYFRNKEELLKKLQYYLKEDGKRKEIAKAGFTRVQEEGYEIIDFAEKILQQLRNEKL